MDVSERRHRAARAVIEADTGPFLLSPFVLAELDHLIATRSVDAELALLRDIGERAYDLEPMTRDDIAAAAEIVERYRDLRIGIADASVVLLADRAHTRRILTLDERHFRTIRPLSGGAFTILPADDRA